jgi:hypothetical protein
VLALLPPALSLAWVPLRTHLPDVDLALLLVLAVTACGATGRRGVLLVGAGAAAAGFAFWDTEPYDRLDITRQPDLETLVVLVVVSLVAGELARRVGGRRGGPQEESADLAQVREVAALIASGAELVPVIAAVAGEITRALGSTACAYEAGPPPPAAVVVGRDGRLTAAGDGPGAGEAALLADRAVREGLEIPVAGMGRVLARFVVARPDPGRLVPGRLLTALTLADQVGAALIVQAPDSAVDHPSAAAPAPLRPRLHVVE